MKGTFTEVWAVHLQTDVRDVIQAIYARRAANDAAVVDREFARVGFWLRRPVYADREAAREALLERARGELLPRFPCHAGGEALERMKALDAVCSTALRMGVKGIVYITAADADLLGRLLAKINLKAELVP